MGPWRRSNHVYGRSAHLHLWVLGILIFPQNMAGVSSRGVVVGGLGPLVSIPQQADNSQHELDQPDEEGNPKSSLKKTVKFLIPNQQSINDNLMID